MKDMGCSGGKMEFDEFYEAGAVVLVEYDVVGGKPANGLARGHYRLQLQLVLIVLFVLLLVGVAGVTGLKAALSFVFTGMVLWKLFFPLLLRGYPPIATGLAVVALLTGVITFSVGGLNRRGTATFAGSMLGVLLTCGLTVWFARAFDLHGAVRPFAETLLYSGYYNLRLTEIFIASVFIASSGAVMDLAMDIAASMDEISRKHPQIDFFEHLRSGLRVGRAVIGTMTTTLLLAYSSSHIAMFLLFMAKGLPVANIKRSFVRPRCSISWWAVLGWSPWRLSPRWWPDCFTDPGRRRSASPRRKRVETMVPSESLKSLHELETGYLLMSGSIISFSSAATAPITLAMLPPNMRLIRPMFISAM
jgi:hypothetical protein